MIFADEGVGLRLAAAKGVHYVCDLLAVAMIWAGD